MSLQIWLPLNGDFHNQGTIGNLNFSTNGTITDTDEGKIGKAKEFTSARVQAPLSYTLGSEITVACWIYCTALPSSGGNAWILELGGTNSGYANALVGMSLNSTDKFVVCLGGVYYSSIVVNLAVNTWYHFAYTWDGSTWKVYKNGEIIQTFTKNVNDLTLTTSTNFSIGSNVANSNSKLKGRLNDIRIYNKCLSDNEIKKLAQGLILHHPLNRNGWGQDNCITWLSNTNNYTISAGTSTSKYFWITKDLQPNTTYTFSAEVTIDNAEKCTLYNYTDSSNKGSIYNDFPADGQRHSWTFTTTATALGFLAYVGIKGSTAGNNAVYKNLKIQKGTKATPYIPKESENLYTLMNINNNVQYDISGYQNNGIKDNITYDSDTAKYNVSSVFNSANQSYIKINDNNWIPQYQQALTINVWAYSSNWASMKKIYSCLQSGGLGTAESSTSGYMRMSVYTADNEQRTSHSYKYNDQELKVSDINAGWHMITFVYDSAVGHKVYLDGVLHSHYDYISYGIKYNMNARLFLGCEANTAAPTSPFLNGKLSDFRMYATVLSDKEILSLYNNEAYIDQLNVIHGEIR